MQFIIALVLALITSSALAETPMTPSQTALQINAVVGQWAQTIETQAKQIADLQKQLDEAKKCEVPNAK